MDRSWERSRSPNIDEADKPGRTRREQTSGQCPKRSGDRVTLNIGGTRFYTTRATLLNEANSYFSALLESGGFQVDDAGEYFVDRNSRLFDVILDYWRENRRDGWLGIDTTSLSGPDQWLLANNIAYYNVESLFWMVSWVEMAHCSCIFDWHPWSPYDDGEPEYFGFEVVRRTALPLLFNFEPLTLQWHIVEANSSDDSDSDGLPWAGLAAVEKCFKIRTRHLHLGGLHRAPMSLEGEIQLHRPGERYRIVFEPQLNHIRDMDVPTNIFCVELKDLQCSRPAALGEKSYTTFEYL